jgi:hypothetical protein
MKINIGIFAAVGLAASCATGRQGDRFMKKASASVK